MSKDKPHSDEEELRRNIRAEIEKRDRERREARQQKEAQRAASEQTEIRRRIYREELRKYYRDRPGYREVINDDGEVDFVPEEEAAEGHLLFDDVMEDPYQARKWQKVILLFSIFFACVAAVALYFILHEGKGTIQVYCNVPQARVILDATPTDHYTNAKIEALPAGEHFVTVEKPGYTVEGSQVQKVDLKDGENKVVTFTLIKVDESSQGSVSSEPPSEEGGTKP